MAEVIQQQEAEEDRGTRQQDWLSILIMEKPFFSLQCNFFFHQLLLDYVIVYSLKYYATPK